MSTSMQSARGQCFADAAGHFEQAAQQVHDLLIRESDLKQSIILRKVDMETIEARWIADGSATGGNAEQRKAALLLLRREDAEYQEVWQQQIADEREVARVEAALELARDGRSISKRRCDMVIAVTNREAAE